VLLPGDLDRFAQSGDGAGRGTVIRLSRRHCRGHRRARMRVR
jgi:hypothetical protein